VGAGGGVIVRVLITKQPPAVDLPLGAGGCRVALEKPYGLDLKFNFDLLNRKEPRLSSGRNWQKLTFDDMSALFNCMVQAHSWEEDASHTDQERTAWLGACSRMIPLSWKCLESASPGRTCRGSFGFAQDKLFDFGLNIFARQSSFMRFAQRL
jgi:hypothetical protein